MNDTELVKTGRDNFGGPILSVKDLVVSFYTMKGKIKALKGIDLEVNTSEIIGLVGESGCGKSVTSMSIADLLPQKTGIIESGNILFKGVDLAAIYREKYSVKEKENEKASIRYHRNIDKKIASKLAHEGIKMSMIFQDPMASLDPLFKVDAQLLETILWNNLKTMGKRVMEKAFIQKELDNFTRIVRETATNQIEDLVKEKYDAHEFANEISLILNMNVSETEKRRRIIRAVEETTGLSQAALSSIEHKINSMKKRVYKPSNKPKTKLRKISNPLLREAELYSMELLEFLGLPDPIRVLDSYPHQLSGGMKQRVMIALAIASGPDLLIADEPTTALDVTTQAQILQILKDLNSKVGTTIIFISHDLGVISSIADRIAVMYAGKIMQTAPIDEFFENPLHPYAVSLLKCLPQNAGEFFHDIPGDLPDLKKPPTGCLFYDRCESAMDKCKENYPPPITVKNATVSCWLFEEGNQ